MSPAETVRTVLEESRRKGWPFARAWHKSLRQLTPPADADPRLIAEHKADKPLFREMKAHWRAAYERREATPTELEVGLVLAEQRLRDLIVYEDQRAQRAA